MHQENPFLSPATCHALLAEIEPGSTFMTIRPMGADGTHPAYVLAAQTASGVEFRLAVKCYRSDFGPGADRAQREFQTLTLLQKYEVPVPEPLYLDETGALLGGPALVTRFVSGQQLLTAADALPYARALAKTLVKIHAVPIGPDEKQFLGEANSEMLWFRKTGIMPTYMTNHPAGALVWQAVADLLATRTPIEPTFVHTDYWMGQILWEGQRINAVLDWEEAGYGDPAYDVAYCRMDMYLSRMGPQAADELLHVYEAEMGRPVANLSLWEFAVTPRPMHNPEWEAICRQELHDFIADVQRRIL